VSKDANNSATLGTDNLIYVPATSLPPETDANNNTGYGVGTPTTFSADAISNTMFGFRAGAGLASGGGDYNIGIGGQALQSLTTGSYNTLVGHNAGEGILDQSFFSGIGINSGPTVVGAGWEGVAAGSSALAGNSATALGSRAEARGTASTAIGYQAIATLDYQIMLGTPSERVYVNNDPVNPLEVATKQYADTIYRDTGWRNIAGFLSNGWTQLGGFGVKLRRCGNTVHLSYALSATATTAFTIMGPTDLLAGFRGYEKGMFVYVQAASDRSFAVSTSTAPYNFLDIYGGQTYTLVGSTVVQGSNSWLTLDPWPTTLPGTPITAAELLEQERLEHEMLEQGT